VTIICREIDIPEETYLSTINECKFIGRSSQSMPGIRIDNHSILFPLSIITNDWYDIMRLQNMAMTGDTNILDKPLPFNGWDKPAPAGYLTDRLRKMGANLPEHYVENPELSSLVDRAREPISRLGLEFDRIDIITSAINSQLAICYIIGLAFSQTGKGTQADKSVGDWFGVK